MGVVFWKHFPLGNLQRLQLHSCTIHVRSVPDRNHVEYRSTALPSVIRRKLMALAQTLRSAGVLAVT